MTMTVEGDRKIPPLRKISRYFRDRTTTLTW